MNVQHCASVCCVGAGGPGMRAGLAAQALPEYGSGRVAPVNQKGNMVCNWV